MPPEIPEIPEIPPSLLDKINEENVAFFLGAGVSKIIGCSDWKKVALDLIKLCYNNGYIDFKQKESLEIMTDLKKIITICFKLLENKEKMEEFFKILNKSCDLDKELKEKYDIYNELRQISAIFITTNIDEHFDEFFRDRIVSDEKDFSPDNVKIDKLYKIHGTLKTPDSIIFTVPQYLGRYQNENYINFLKILFKKYTIVFIGYGLNEFEILDFLITKMEKSKEINHFILLPYYIGEEYLINYDELYYNNLGIHVIPYLKNTRGYSQLYFVIKKWKEVIHESTDLYRRSVKNMEELMKSVE